MKADELMIGFKYIPQYENLYSIDRSGNVFSHISGKILKPHPNHRFKYVHELQHALKLCGINKEITL